MAYKTPTPNLGLIEPQPGTGEKIRLTDINSNWDTIDARVGAVPSNTSLQAQITALSGDTSAKAKDISLTSSDNTWAEVWEKINVLSNGETAPIYIHGTAMSTLSSGVRSGKMCTGTVSRLGTNRFSFLLGDEDKNEFSADLSSATSSSSGTYTEKTVFMADIAQSISDMNNARKTGIYKAGPTVSNAPVASGYWLIEVSTFSDTDVTQVATMINGNKTKFFRVCDTNVWSAWKEFAEIVTHEVASGSLSTQQDIKDALANDTFHPGVNIIKYLSVSNNTPVAVLVLHAASNNYGAGIWMSYYANDSALFKVKNSNRTFTLTAL